MTKPRPSASKASTTLGSSSKRYSEEFKRAAVRLVTDEQYTFRAAAKAVSVSLKSLRDWYAKYASPVPEASDAATVQELRDENQRLRQQLRRAELEREILKKAAVYFAQESQ